MYESFFGFSTNPFTVNPDPRFLFRTAQAQEALAGLAYGIHARKGFVLLTGEVGTGKTTLLNLLREWLKSKNMPAAFLFHSHIDPNQFLESVLLEFGIPTRGKSKGQLMVEFRNWLLEKNQNGGTAVLMVDEAQNLSSQILEEVRLLTNLETPTSKLLQIVVSGQPELEKTLQQTNLRQLRQRLTIRCKTHPLSASDTKGYIEYRLRVSGASGRQIFEPEAIARIHAYSAGVPRLVNLICEHALVSSFADGQRIVKIALIDTVAQELELTRDNQHDAADLDRFVHGFNGEADQGLGGMTRIRAAGKRD